ncbi:MAG TPA: T9SS type A sorting domain-containing protein, partial [Puia sp.]|nr:T9SS type A sorting domain-containing protein [Puia sp.]
VPTYYNITLSGTITTAQWNGSSGGVTVINAVNQLNMNSATVTALGMGFRGGGGVNYNGQAGAKKTDYMTLSTQTSNGSKGEGIAGTPRFINTYIGGIYAVQDNGAANEGYPNGSFSRGAPGNAGGGGTDSDPTANDQNSGGGGGGNGNVGGYGGNGWSSFGATGGRGGMMFMNQTSPYPVYYSPSRLIMGGGGGAGTINNGTGVPANGPAASGVSGGGIIIINATAIIGNGTIDASGASGSANIAISPQIDGAGGGGAGGSILIYANSGHAGITANAIGGNGGSNYPGPAYGATGHGPGGSGGGGVIFSNGTLNAASSVMGGQPGYSYAVATSSHYGADSSYHNGALTQTFPAAQLPPNMTTCQISVLAVNLLNFDASYVSSNTVLVSWATANQGNISSFEVERSLDGTNYAGVGQVSASQSTDETHNYSLNDYLTGVNASVIYYRLKMTGADGNFSYSRIIPVRLTGSDMKISLYPNPASDYAVLSLFSGSSSTATMRLLDNSGRQLMIRSFGLNNGNNSLLIDKLSSLPKGIYFVQVFVDNTQYNEKLVKN